MVRRDSDLDGGMRGGVVKMVENKSKGMERMSKINGKRVVGRLWNL